jgi:hypothetical protein
MPHEVKPAVVFLRMSPQLREGLKTAAEFSGCTLNAFAVQVLDVECDRRGYPLDWRERAAHINARDSFIVEMNSQSEAATDDVWALVKKYDTENPGYFVEWWRLRQDRSR